MINVETGPLIHLFVLAASEQKISSALLLCCTPTTVQKLWRIDSAMTALKNSTVITALFLYGQNVKTVSYSTGKRIDVSTYRHLTCLMSMLPKHHAGFQPERAVNNEQREQLPICM